MMNINVLPLLALNPWIISSIVVLVVLIIAVVVLYFYGNKMQKKQAAAQEQMEATKQTASLLVIDKKRMKLKEAGLPQIVIDQTPRYLRGSKVPIVKAKIGPKIMTLMCDEKVFEIIPVKKEVKVVMNGIYIMEVKGARGGLEEKKEKVGFFKRMTNMVIKDKTSKDKTATAKDKGSKDKKKK